MILEVEDQNGTVREYKIEWPFDGPPPTGGTTEIMIKVDKILSDNKIDCPPKRVKISEKIWKCGNGKKIRTQDEKLGLLLSKAWD